MFRSLRRAGSLATAKMTGMRLQGEGGVCQEVRKRTSLRQGPASACERKVRLPPAWFKKRSFRVTVAVAGRFQHSLGPPPRGYEHAPRPTPTAVAPTHPERAVC